MKCPVCGSSAGWRRVTLTLDRFRPFSAGSRLLKPTARAEGGACRVCGYSSLQTYGKPQASER